MTCFIFKVSSILCINLPLLELKTAERLRNELQEATKHKDKVALRQIIDDCEGVAYPELSWDLCKARDTLESLGGGRGG